jgi:hypothetical protein
MFSHEQDTLTPRIKKLLKKTRHAHHYTVTDFLTRVNRFVQGRLSIERDVHTLINVSDSMAFFIEEQSFASVPIYLLCLLGCEALRISYPFHMVNSA